MKQRGYVVIILIVSILLGLIILREILQDDNATAGYISANDFDPTCDIEIVFRLDRIRKIDFEYGEEPDVAARRELLEETGYNARQLEKLHVDNIQSLGPGNWPSLETVILGSLTWDISGLRGSPKLKELHGTRSCVEDLYGIENAKGLEVVYLSGTPVRVLEPLNQARTLKRLDISRTRVRSLEPLRDMTELKHLDASNLTHLDVSTLNTLTGLRKPLMLLRKWLLLGQV